MFKIIHVLTLVVLASASGASVVINDDGALQNQEDLSNLSPSTQIQGNLDLEANQVIDFDSDFMSTSNNFQEEISVESNVETNKDKTEINPDSQNEIDESVELSIII